MIENCMYYFKELWFLLINILFFFFIVLFVFEIILYEENEIMYLFLKEDLFFVILNFDFCKKYIFLLFFKF